MTEGVRAPNLPLGTDLGEFIGHEIVGTTRSVKRFTRASVIGAAEALTSSYQAGGGVIFSTRDQANTSLNYDALRMAWVVLDPSPANNGIYQKSGASGSGSWTRFADLPYSFYRLENVGAGTANAIAADNQYPIPSENALVVVNVTSDNTASPVTLTINGGTPLTVKTSSGNDIAIGGFVAGMLVAGYIDGTEFRLITDEVSSAIVTAAEAARTAAETARDAALSAVPNVFPLTAAALKALDTTTITSAYLKETGKSGQFAWRTGDYSSQVAADTGGGVYIKADAIATTSGAWERLFNGDVELSWFGGDLAAATAIASLLKRPLYLGAKGDTITIAASWSWTIPADLVVYGTGVKIDASSGNYKAVILGERSELRGVEIQGPGNDAYNASSIGVFQSGTNNAPAAPTYVEGGKVIDCYIHDFRGGAIQYQYVSDFEVTDTSIKNVGYYGFMGLSVANGRMSGITVDTIGPGTNGNAYGVAFSRNNGTETAEPRSTNCICQGSVVKNNTIWEAFDSHAGDGILYIDCIADGVSVGFSLTASNDGSNAQLLGPKRCGIVRCKAINALTDATKRSMGLSISGATTGAAVVDYAEDCFVHDFYSNGYGYDRADASLGAAWIRTTLRFVGSNIHLVVAQGGGLTMQLENAHYTIRDLLVHQWGSEQRDVSAFIIPDVDNIGHVDGYIFTRGLTSATYPSKYGFSSGAATTFTYKNGRSEAPTKTNFAGAPTAYDDA